MLASFCGTCGLQFQSNDTFCARCGTPRDTDVSETTALQVPAPNTPTVLSSNPQTFCIKCGQPHSANVFPCPFCNSSVPTIQTQMPIATQMATDVPTPPLIIKNPTPKQIFAAMVSDANPYGYGAWGKLVINGNTKNPWDFPFRKNSSSSPDITHAGLLTTIIGNGEAHIMPNVRCQDFVYQAAITFPNGFGIGGLAFRIDVVGDECYYCGLNRSSPNKETVYVTLRSLDPRIIQTETLLLIIRVMEKQFAEFPEPGQRRDLRASPTNGESALVPLLAA
jgi:hypothetical protein